MSYKDPFAGKLNTRTKQDVQTDSSGAAERYREALKRRREEQAKKSEEKKEQE